MKRLVVGVFLLLGCFLLALWSPWLYWNIDLSGLFGVKKPDAIAGLQVYSLSGEVEIFLDGTSVGKVKVETSPYIVDKVTPGEHLVTLRRVSSVDNAYWQFGKIINFAQNTTVVVSYNLGPEPEFSEGNVIYAVKKTDTSKQSQVNVTSNVNNFNFQFDDIEPIKVADKTTSLPIDLNGQHKIKITKDGFETFEFIILPETQKDRDKLKDYDINIEVQLMYKPL